MKDDRRKAILTEIQTDPAGLGYAGKKPAAQATLMSAPSAATAVLPVDVAQLARWTAATNGRQRLLAAASDAGKGDNVRGAADAILLYLASGMPAFDTVAWSDALAVLVGDGALKQDMVDALTALATVPVAGPSRAEVLGLGTVTQGDVEEAEK